MTSPTCDVSDRHQSPTPTPLSMETTPATRSDHELRRSNVHAPRNNRRLVRSIRSNSSTCGRCMETTRATRFDEGPSVHAQRPHRHGWKVKRRMRIAYYHHHIRADYSSSEARGQKLVSTPPLLHVMKYMVPSVLVLVTLKYQAKTESLFRENPAPVWCFVLAYCVYWLMVGAMKQMTTIDGKYFQTLSRGALACSVLSIISLASVFLAYPVSLLPVTVLISFPVVLALAYTFFVSERNRMCYQHDTWHISLG